MLDTQLVIAFAIIASFILALIPKNTKNEDTLTIIAFLTVAFYFWESGKYINIALMLDGSQLMEHSDIVKIGDKYFSDEKYSSLNDGELLRNMVSLVFAAGFFFMTKIVIESIDKIEKYSLPFCILISVLSCHSLSQLLLNSDSKYSQFNIQIDVKEEYTLFNKYCDGGIVFAPKGNNYSRVRVYSSEREVYCFDNNFNQTSYTVPNPFFDYEIENFKELAIIQKAKPEYSNTLISFRQGDIPLNFTVEKAKEEIELAIESVNSQIKIHELVKKASEEKLKQGMKNQVQWDKHKL